MYSQSNWLVRLLLVPEIAVSHSFPSPFAHRQAICRLRFHHTSLGRGWRRLLLSPGFPGEEFRMVSDQVDGQKSSGVCKAYSRHYPRCVPQLMDGAGRIVRPSEDDAKHVANDTSEPFLSVISVPSQSRGDLTSAKQQPRLDSARLLRHKYDKPIANRRQFRESSCLLERSHCPQS